MDLEFTGKIFYWRGPSPYHFVTVPAEQSGDKPSTNGPRIIEFAPIYSIIREKPVLSLPKDSWTV